MLNIFAFVYCIFFSFINYCLFAHFSIGFYILDINSLSTICTANIFSHSASYFLTWFIYIISTGLFYVNLVTAGNYVFRNPFLWMVLGYRQPKEKPVHDLEGKNEAEAIILGGSWWSDTVTDTDLPWRFQLVLSGAQSTACLHDVDPANQQQTATGPCVQTQRGCSYTEVVVSIDLPFPLSLQEPDALGFLNSQKALICLRSPGILKTG